MTGHARHEGLLAGRQDGGVDVRDRGGDDGLDRGDIERLRISDLGLLGRLIERREPGDHVAHFGQSKGIHRRHTRDGRGQGLDILTGHAPAITGDIDVDVVLILLDEGADQRPAVGEVDVHGAVTGHDTGAGVHNGLQEIAAVAALGDTGKVRTGFATRGMRIIRRAVTTQALAGGQSGEQREAVLGVPAFERRQPLSEFIVATGDRLLRGGEGFLDGRLGAERGGLQKLNRGRRDALGLFECLEALDEERVDTGCRQVGEGLPGALTTSSGAGRSGLRELDETLRGIQMGKRADGDHGDFVLLILGILAGDLGEVGGLTLEPKVEGFGAGGSAELGIGDQAGEEIIGQ